MNILLVEDDPQVMETVHDYLAVKGHEIDCAYHGKAALTLAESAAFDIIILDVMMPKMDGLEAAKAIRQQLNQSTPILFLTARDTLDDKLAGFAAGGDDYLVKPFALQELEARIKALTMRSRGHADSATLSLGSLIYHVEHQRGKTQQGEFSLPVIQHQILHTLLNASPGFVSKNQFIERIWQNEEPDSDAFRSHLYKLRKALAHYAPDVEIVTEQGRGYRLVQRAS